jgi:Ca2+/Na+ antiporter
MLFVIVRTLHILAGIWFTCGVAAYLLTRFTMLKSDDVRSVHAMVGLLARFRNLMIRPGSMLLLIFGLWAAWYESWPRFTIHAIVLLVILVPFVVLTVRGGGKIEAASAEAVQAGSVTPALSAALRDRKVVVGEVGIGIITLLFLLMMIIKPS